MYVCKVETLGEKVLDVKAKALVHMVSDTLTKAKAETLNDTDQCLGQSSD